MESSRSEDFFGVLVEKIGLTIWCPDFCDGHQTELCSIAETLSYLLGDFFSSRYLTLVKEREVANPSRIWRLHCRAGLVPRPENGLLT